MKKWMLTAVVILALNGYAAAQKAPKKDSRTMAKTEKKGIDPKPGIDKKAEVASESLTPQKLAFANAPADSSLVVPGARKQDE